MTIKLFPKQTAEMMAREQASLREGHFEQFYLRPSQIWREYRKVYGNPESQWHDASTRMKLEDLIETFLLMLWTFSGMVLFEVCGKDDRAWLTGDGAIMLERNPWK